MHNGSIAAYKKVRRKFLSSLSDELFEQIEGTTDSELAFAIFLNILPSLTELLPCETLVEAMKKTIRLIIDSRVIRTHRGGIISQLRTHRRRKCISDALQKFGRRRASHSLLCSWLRI
eukprot:TRINITY_DN12634_c0_g1_i4.p1 TRINITY_DN12634_c0_g1~~TRINITY_DN12634_c0_g1_i4.p1  ORF type:complete len:118 (+),score=2.86 TRINITY_DN12634_c0_g1_i4:530-883(+)